MYRTFPKYIILRYNTGHYEYVSRNGCTVDSPNDPSCTPPLNSLDHHSSSDHKS
ncbi:hypothetical protein PGT21_018763 [Puccinia graminis f. sp. tritici]|uniref:Uncharacterized protein n=1 Tax=Puccinia graminis f. sp. tritici TaxID=56615 RepID=A0A5B0Q3A8_PUCGR|nr:hypothetical protein PGT21_018763 [Puccinia graminis f. sp. tritici]